MELTKKDKKEKSLGLLQMAEGVQLESLGTFTSLRRLHALSFSVAGEDSKLRKNHFQMLSYIDLFSERNLVH